MSEVKSLVKKLSEVMAEIGHVPKRGVNTFHNYKYVMEADLCDAVREKLAARNVMMVPSVVDVRREKVTLTNKRGETADSLITDVMIQYSLYDGDSEQVIRFQMPGCGSDTGDKGVYKAITGSDKYALMKAFLIPTGDDPEGDPETDARAEGFKRGSTADQRAVAQKQITSFGEKADALKAEMDAKKASDILDPSVRKQSNSRTPMSLAEGEQVISGPLEYISKEMPTKAGKPYVFIEVAGHRMNVFDKTMFSAPEGEKSALDKLMGRLVNVTVEKKGKFTSFVSMELADIQTGLEDLGPEPAEEPLPFG